MKKPVIIIGAGLSGLYAASLLTAAGVDYQIIESRNRIGGRVLTETAASAGFDLGPTWFWPEHEPIITELTKKLGLKTFPQHTTGQLLFEQSKSDPAQRHSLPTNSIERSERIVGGVQSLIEAIASTIPDQTIELNTRVTNILINEAGAITVSSVKSSGDTHSIEAESVILALPPRLIHNISFSPDLPQIPDLPTLMAGQAKVVAVYDQPFWREAGLSGQAMSWVGPLQEIHDASPETGAGALFGFFSLSADQRRELGQEKIRLLVIEQLTRLYGEEAGQPAALLYKDWSLDADTATDQDGRPLTDFPQYQPIQIDGEWNEKLMFAGTETSATSGGHLEGALWSAERAVKQVLQRK
ncbi:flavin monoamine oxidase family protein [Jeotgalibacillus terrae]|uniref:Flavin monoamine oxidase family protein n=1 Tax=Jeotgalibacillus terrae TaxID=587735 RepID=A0ABW5ZL92_9BACL|nr:FAD-dependent oxidoreductase [Jeotgalibacillus terrae]MBM7578024.1 monoamine oxidase [Jeotgalibacillus terrae]